MCNDGEVCLVHVVKEKGACASSEGEDVHEGGVSVVREKGVCSVQ